MARGETSRTIEGSRLRRAGIDVLLASGRHIPVSGGCMAPAVPVGAQARVESCHLSGIRPGDVVLLEREGKFVLHRFLATLYVGTRRYLLVKPDRGRRPDSPWPAESLVGRLSEIREGEAVRPYRPGFRDRVRAVAAGFLWSTVVRLLKEARGFVWSRARRRRS